MGCGDTLDETMHSQAAQIIGDASGGILARLVPEQWSKALPQVLMSKRAADVEEQEQDVEQGLDAAVGETQGCGALAVHGDGSLHVLECSFSDKAVVADALDVEQTSIGCEAYGAKLFEIFEASADFEVAGIVDGRFGS